VPCSACPLLQARAVLVRGQGHITQCDSQYYCSYCSVPIPEEQNCCLVNCNKSLSLTERHAPQAQLVQREEMIRATFKPCFRCRAPHTPDAGHPIHHFKGHLCHHTMPAVDGGLSRVQVAAVWGQDSHDSGHACRWQQKYIEAKTAMIVVMNAGGSRNILRPRQP